MTVKLVVLYAQPDDADEFEQHYLETHMPMVMAIPGLQGAEAARFVGAADGGAQDVYRIAELYFADRDALNTALGTEEGKATAGDYRQIAPTGSRMYIADVD